MKDKLWTNFQLRVCVILAHRIPWSRDDFVNWFKSRNASLEILFNLHFPPSPRTSCRWESRRQGSWSTSSFWSRRPRWRRGSEWWMSEVREKGLRLGRSEPSTSRNYKKEIFSLLQQDRWSRWLMVLLQSRQIFFFIVSGSGPSWLSPSGLPGACNWKKPNSVLKKAKIWILLNKLLEKKAKH